MPSTPILIIDDEPAVIESLREFLEDEGYEVHEALEGHRGLEVFREVNPDLVVADLKMPGMSGMEVIGAIRKIKQSVPIIVVTGYASLDSARDAMRLDVFDFISKPIDLELFKDALDRARASLGVAQEIEREVVALREQLAQFQKQWKEQLDKFSEVEPLIHAGRLMAGIIHDLNNPLTYIMGQAELLQMLHPEVEDINVILEQAERMNRIMSSVMRRMRAAQTRRVEWLQVNDLLCEEVAFLDSHPCFKTEIDKEWNLDPSLPPIRVLATEFSQVFGNLLRNAADAMQGKSVKRLSIRTWTDAAGIHVSIQDSGPGIPLDIQRIIFEPFFSTKKSGTFSFGSMGMGIGLYHCELLLRRYGGRIDLESTPGMGATFTIHLPFSLADNTLESEKLESPQS